MSDSPHADSIVSVCRLLPLEEYDDKGVVKLPVADGTHFNSYVLNILPGQEVPSHSHLGYEVILIPQTGSATLFSKDAKPVRLVRGSVYTDHRDINYGLRNNGASRFQVLVILIKASSQQSESHEPAN